MELLAPVEARRGASHYGAALQETATEKAERSLRAGLQELGWAVAELGTGRKGGRAKVQLAMRLRGETTMTLAWIAVALQMGTGASVSNLVSAQRRGKGWCHYLGPAPATVYFKARTRPGYPGRVS